MSADQLAAVLLCAVAVAALAWSRVDRRRRDRAFAMSVHPSSARFSRIDAMVESALREGPLDEATEVFDARLLPLSDSQVAQRIRAQMDENAAVRELRADVEAWPFQGGAA